MSEKYRLGKLKGGFVVVWSEGGHRRRYRLGAVDSATARVALREFVRGRERLEAPEASQLTLADLWRAYLVDRENAGKTSLPRMRDAWKALEPDFGLMPVRQLTPDLARAYAAKRRRAGVGDGTIHTELAYLRAAVRKGAKAHGFTAPDVPLPPKPRTRERAITPDEACRLIEAAEFPHVRLFILLALHTAGRPSSILDLTWSRVDFVRGRINLDNPERDRTPKGRANVPLVPALLAPLQEARAAAQSDFVIEWGGKPCRSVKGAIRRAAARAGMKGVTPYTFRHTAAVLMAEAGVPMSEISQYLGHTSTATTERKYARYSPGYLKRAGGAIEAALAPFATSNANQAKK